MGIDFTKLSDEELDAMHGAGSAPAPERPDFTAMSDEELDRVQADEPEDEAPQEASLEDIQRGQSGARFLTGVGSLLTGPYQLGANIGDALYQTAIDPIMEAGKNIGVIPEEVQPSSYADELNEGFKQHRESAARGQGALGRGEFDAQGLAGSVIAGLPAAMKLTGLTGAVKGGAIFGGATPVTDGGEGFHVTKAGQVAYGAGGGGLLHSGGKLAGWSWDKIAPYLRDTVEATRIALRATVGDKADDIIKALKEDFNPLTQGSAGEVAVPAQSTKFSAVQKAVDADASDEAFARVKLQNTERQKVLSDIADLEDPAIAFRDDVTNPMRDRALTDATDNTTKEISLKQARARLEGEQQFKPVTGPGVTATGDAATNVRNVPNAVRDVAGLKGVRAQAEHAAQNTATPWGMKIPARHTPAQTVLQDIEEPLADAKLVETLVKSERDMVKSQLSSMEAHGVKGAKVNNIVAGVDDMMKTPEVVGNSELRKVMTKVRRDIKGMVGEDGVVSPKALYIYRKTGLDVTLDKFVKANPSIKQSVTEAITHVKPILDDVIADAAGGGWKEYLKAYSKLSRPVNQGKLGKELKKSYTSALSEGRVSPARLTQAVEEAKATLRKSGVRASELGDVLNPKQLGKVDNLRADLTRADEFQQLAQAGSKGGPAVTQADTVQIGNALIREITVFNNLSRWASESQQKVVAQRITKLFQRDPQTGYAALAQALEDAAPKAKGPLRKLMSELGGAAAQAAPRIPGQTAEFAQ